MMMNIVLLDCMSVSNELAYLSAVSCVCRGDGDLSSDVKRCFSSVLPSDSPGGSTSR